MKYVYINEIVSGFQILLIQKPYNHLKSNFFKIMPINLLSIYGNAKNIMCYMWSLTLEFVAFL